MRPRVLNGSKNRAPAAAAAAAAAVSAQHANSPRITQLPSRADRRRLSDGLFTLLNLACMSAAAALAHAHGHTHTHTRAHAHTVVRPLVYRPRGHPPAMDRVTFFSNGFDFGFRRPSP